MKERKFKKAKEELISDCQEIMHRNKVKPRFLKRVIAVNMYLNGIKQKEICKLNGISQKALSNWLYIAEEQGIEGLEDKPHKA
ncbi:MAG: helix-turn-helix domain-containing protein [Treponema sp.]|nr:helix-turn-helix domain-containing protein [Treponema sp.]MBR0104443.1 helix-turn-helix domain-containing protein [Bacillota bacterium]